jgi:hypothetical protein
LAIIALASTVQSVGELLKTRRVTQKKDVRMTNNLRPIEIRCFLEQLSAAIQLDQIHVDSLPDHAFASAYSEDMWRIWRRGHLVFISKLLSTAEAMSSLTLKQLSYVTSSHDPSLIGASILELLAEVVSGSCPEEDLATSELLFKIVIKELATQRGVGGNRVNAHESITRWLPSTDPLSIVRDPECGYDQMLC